VISGCGLCGAARGAIRSANHLQEDRFGIRGAIQGADHRGYEEIRQRRTAAPRTPRTWRDDLHDVESILPRRQIRQRPALGSPSDVLRSTNRWYDLGCRRARLPRFAESTVSWCSAADNRVYDSSAQLVGRNACAQQATIHGVVWWPFAPSRSEVDLWWRAASNRKRRSPW
jgi:hypothetical protein